MAQPLASTSPPATTSSTHNTSHKKHNRHHVKRRSSGRVHVTKLAPMARTKDSHTDTEVDEHDGKRPHMRRSQSQRSLNRLSSLERKGSGLTALASIHPPKTNTAGPTSNTTTYINSDVARVDPTVATTATSPQTTPSPPPSATDKDGDGDEDEEEGEVVITRKEPTDELQPPLSRARKDSPAFFVSSRAPAAPIEQTLTVVAKNLVGSDRESTTPLHNNATVTTSTASHNNYSSNSNNSKRPQPLRSQFVDDTTDLSHRQQQVSGPSSGGITSNNRRLSNVAAAANAQPPGMTRTQQKLLLQRQHCLVDDENNLAHPRNMLRLTREMERVGKEYRCVRQYRDPMAESLQRCLQQEQRQQQHQHQEPMRLQQRTQSSSVIPTSVSLEPHAGQRQIIHRRHLQLKLMAETGNQHDSGLLNSAQASSAGSTLDMIRWSAGALLDRVWNGTGIN